MFRWKDLYNVPNLLTLFRILCIGFVVMAFRFGQIPLALLFYLVAAATDVLDGYIARRWKLVTSIGKLLDPFADKCMLVAVLSCMCVQRMVPLYILIIVFIKELVLVISASALLGKKDVVVSANWIGKASALLFFCAVVLTFFHSYVKPYDNILMLVATVGAYFSMAQYGYLNIYKPYLAKKKT